MISKDSFINIIKRIRENDKKITEAESSLGFEISASGAISELFDVIYDLLKHLANIPEEKEYIFFDDLGKILFIYPFPEEEMEEFYNIYFEKVV